MAESRNQTRAGCLVHGQISAPDLPDAIDCTLWDVSPEGARLILPEVASVPDKISISNPFSLSPREAEVCWRAGNEVGIRLLGEAASASEPALAEKIRLAEATNAELVQRLREAQRQLETAETRSHQANAVAGAAAHSAAAGRDRAFTYVLDDEARILVTDDDPILREFARVHLTTPSASVEVA